ncbi:AbrB/MazE/SpoVT family DNA-binding domain-containing protein [Herbivorax sp. ANBcel31]|uniref:AbrB/MazE/SpoVT family DNA-binding domain-containing protein n=1 Tax=Herbivorax sp. ANBcel31 TaxID=3069754 RepID=UPI0027B60071|nr:AbrB/MazE/SpoVT family DNA-binding domain-containing protein [Herbivorax sp. ANBcel31]MDQ2085731.1 AbrB/MazE/SpoVT family DNA-binding domain-containing protein [Herbivorax sp. ANBcel31]
MSLVSKIQDNSLMKIPKEIIEKAGLKPGDDIIWYYDDRTKQIILSGKPENFAKELKGLGKEIWKQTDSISYVQEERSSW